MIEIDEVTLMRLHAIIENAERFIRELHELIERYPATFEYRREAVLIGCRVGRELIDNTSESS